MRYNVHEGTWNAAKNAVLKLKNKTVLIVNEMPVSPSVGTTVLYAGDNGTYTNGGIYRFQDNMWVLINATSGTTLYADTPIGTIQAYGGATAPAGWLLCKGQLASRETYADLFAVIGDNFGVGDGSTTFNLPDLREATTKGIGENPNATDHVKAGGLSLGEYLDDRLQDFRGSSKWRTFGPSDTAGWNFLVQSSSGTTVTGRFGATTEVKSVGVNYIIKATQSVLPYDIVSAIKKANTFVGTTELVVESYVTTGSTSLSFTVPFSVALENITTLSAVGRHIEGGYIDSATSSSINLLSNEYNLSVAYSTDFCTTFTCTKSSGFKKDGGTDNVLNNTPVSLRLRITAI